MINDSNSLKNLIIILVLLTITGAESGGSPVPVPFEKYFTDQTLRIDCFHTGNAREEILSINELRLQGAWAGSRVKLIDPFQMGQYRLTLHTKEDVPIYSRGFDSYFAEYRTTVPAKEGNLRTYEEVLLMPLPKDTVRLVVEHILNDRSSVSILDTLLAIPNIQINTETRNPGADTIRVGRPGPPHQMVDICLLSEGYTEAQRGKFVQDIAKISEILLSWEPYNRYREKFNMYGVFTPSPQSGVDQPRRNLFAATVFDASFNSLNSERYLLTESLHSAHDAASAAPYDVILFIVNSDRYGGGGIYRSFGIFTSDGSWPEHLFHHEFGHTFAGLADEYYDAEVAYEDFFPPGIEPAVPNLTIMTDPSGIKWRNLLNPGLAVPTPWNKSEYDSLVLRHGQLRTEKDDILSGMSSRESPPDSIRLITLQYEREVSDTWDRIVNFMRMHPLRGQIGVFEGGGYRSGGIYRPTVNSVMHRFIADEKSFHAVNEAAIIRMIGYYTGEQARASVGD